ncbi:hypothetical protein PG995_012302 [Apiospora arundinis]
MRRRLPQRHPLTLSPVPRMRLLRPDNASGGRRGHGNPFASLLLRGTATSTARSSPSASASAAFRRVCRSLSWAAADAEGSLPEEAGAAEGVTSLPPPPMLPDAGAVVSVPCACLVSTPESWSEDEDKLDLISDLSFWIISGIVSGVVDEVEQAGFKLDKLGTR